MRKNILMTTFALFVAVGTMAQDGFHKIGVGAEIGLPMGDFGEAYNSGFGATGKVYYGLNENANITGTLGYIRFGLDGGSDVSGHMGMVPIMFGYHHDFDGLYIEPQVGLVALSSKIDMSGFGGSSSATEVSLSLGGGYSTGEWDFGLRYQIVSNANFLRARIAYNFSI
ncbi:MAG: outer membrane beta-barrel protein [Arenibacter sp.]|nr:outer membrane beta-barrel protein [Arenibacter sp.]